LVFSWFVVITVRKHVLTCPLPPPTHTHTHPHTHAFYYIDLMLR
jgi:hypothetical protein